MKVRSPPSSIIATQNPASRDSSASIGSSTSSRANDVARDRRERSATESSGVDRGDALARGGAHRVVAAAGRR